MAQLDIKLVRFVDSCMSKNSETVHRFLETLKALGDTTIKDVYSVIFQLGLPSDLEFLCFELLNEAKVQQVKVNELVFATNIAAKMFIQRKMNEPNIIPVWTGPMYQESPIIHKTYDMVKSLFKTAKNEIFIVGYTFSLEHEYVKSLFNELIRAARRGCRIDIIFNNDQFNLTNLKNNWPDDLRLPHFYYWKGDSESQWASLHSKLILIDQRKLLITSANFTLYGFKKNIETGVIVENHNMVQQVWRQFRALLHNEEMTRYQ
jgi:hypothetical protein